MTRIFVGVAWPYANGPFHIGHLAGAYLPGDEFARYHRLRGDEVLMVSGSDMHGTPILVTAEREGSTPEAVARRFHEVNQQAFARLGVSFDLFTHTHTALHAQTTQELFLRLLENGFVMRRTEENPFCPKHQRFLPDRYLVGTCPHCGFDSARGDECDHCGRVLEPRQLGNPRCSLDGTPALFRPSEHFFLDLKRLQPELTRHLEAHPPSRDNVRGVTENFLRNGLRPTPITRDLDWGVPIPLEGYDAKRFYVWFDAVIGYLSASKEWAVRSGRPSAWERYWKEGEPVRSYYFIGKDNVFHHTLIWPGILLGARGLVLPFDVPANEWMVIGGGKISKSRSPENAPFLPTLLDRYPPDAIRFYATLLAPQNHDTEFDPAEFDRLYEEVLSNQYGNLAQRTLVLVRERCDGRVPIPPDGWTEEGSPTATLLHARHRDVTDAFEQVRLKEALDLTLGALREANRRFHDAQPWQASDPERRRTLFETVWALKAAAVWLAPILPFSSERLFRMLGYPEAPGPGDWDEATRPVPSGQPLGEVRPLFPRRAGPEVDPPASLSPPGEAGPTPLDLRAARVISAEPHPSADRLYVLRLDLGSGTERTVVAGVRSHYSAEQLNGRLVVLLANLAPRTIRRVTSQGMVLAAEAGDQVSLLTVPEGTPAGSPVVGCGEARAISVEEFAALGLRSGRVVGEATTGGSLVDVGGREVRVEPRLSIGGVVVVRPAGPESADAAVLGFPSGPVGVDGVLPSGSRVR